MVCHCKRTCKNSTCLTVLSLTITEKQRIGSRIIVSQLAGLTDEATSQHRAVIHFRAGRDNEVITDYTVSDMNRCRHVTVDAAIG